MTATFGDLARRADEHLAAALGDLDGRLAVSGNCLRTGEAAAAATEIGRISATLSSYLVLGNRARGTTHPWAESVGIVGSELQHAAQALHGLDGGHAGGGGVDGTVPMAGHLAATSQALAHGHDLLASHHPGRGDAALARSLWAESITSPPVMAALLAEIGGWSSQLALLSSCIAYDVWDVPASTRRAMRGDYPVQRGGDRNLRCYRASADVCLSGVAPCDPGRRLASPAAAGRPRICARTV